MKIKLKYYAQYNDFSCGPIALKMVFEHLGIKYSRNKIIKLCHAIPLIGTETEALIKEIINENLVYLEKKDAQIGDLINALESGYLPIVNYINPLSNKGHYSVINGYSKKDKILYFADPLNGQDYCLSFSEFNDTWYNSDKTIKAWFVIIGRELINI